MSFEAILVLGGLGYIALMALLIRKLFP